MRAILFEAAVNIQYIINNAHFLIDYEGIQARGITFRTLRAQNMRQVEYIGACA
jgi:hypothetical protein